MDLTQALIDILRAAHLLFFAAGMGTALYFDYRTFQTFRAPIEHTEIETLDRLHTWISLAFVGLWASGIVLIYVRTGFDFAQFSPKLWLKVSLMTLMIANSYLIGAIAIPVMRASIGASLSELGTGKLMITSQIAITSMFCWSAGLMLGSSVVLKTAPWDILLPLTICWALLLTVGGQLVILIMRKGGVGVGSGDPQPE